MRQDWKKIVGIIAAVLLIAMSGMDKNPKASVWSYGVIGILLIIVIVTIVVPLFKREELKVPSNWGRKKNLADPLE